MKRFICIILFAMTSSMAVMSCTEETVQPTQTEDGGAGDPQGGKI